MVAFTSVVSVLVMVCTEIGASPPTRTLPTRICRDYPPVDVAPGADRDYGTWVRLRLHVPHR